VDRRPAAENGPQAVARPCGRPRRVAVARPERFDALM